MASIRVSEKNHDAIEREIRKAEGRASARTAGVYSVEDAIKMAERRLSVVPKYAWAGATVAYDPWVVPNSYRGDAESTVVYVERRPSGWFFAGAERRRTPHRANGEGNGLQKVELPFSENLLAGILRARKIDLTAVPDTPAA